MSTGPSQMTEYIITLQIDKWPPEALLEAIAKVLRFNMRKRGLWTAPPAWLNYPEWQSWKEPNAFDDLVFDCYEFAVVKRIEGLRNALNRFDNIDGLIFRNIKNFLTEQQSRYDPIGYSVAGNVKKAIQQAIELGELTAQDLDETKKIQNSTLLTFSSTQSTTENSLLEGLRCNKAWAELRLKLVRRSEIAQDDLCEIVCQLADNGIKSFLFKDLVNIIKAEVRTFNTVLDDETRALEDLGGDIPQLVKIIAPDTTYEDWKSWTYFVEQVEKDITQLKPKKRRVRIEKIFRELVRLSKTAESQLSLAELARLLDIPSSTLCEDMKILRDIVQKLRSDDLL